jgi:2-desacetyl-2-hydroxyethyl bacteriochlorophyllide A dehydrogenase
MLFKEDKMKAVRYWGKEEIRYEDIAKPMISEGQALVRISYAGICGSDMYIYSGTHPRAKAPLVLGHEFSGRIAELPEDYDGEFKIGDLVAVNPLLTCNRCVPCLTGNSHVCKSLGLSGIDADGGFAEFVRVNISQLVKLPSQMSDDLGALAEPVAVAVHAVRSSDLRLGDSALVLGGGPIGFLIAYVAKANGAGQVIVVEPNEFRRRISESVGFKVLASADDKAIRQMTKGEGADIVFEAVGLPITIEEAIKNCRIQGQVVVVGVFKHPAPVDLQRVNFAELRIIGTRVYRQTDFVHAVNLIAKYPEIGKVITHKLPLDQAQEGINLMRTGEANLKVLLKP